MQNGKEFSYREKVGQSLDNINCSFYFYIKNISYLLQGILLIFILSFILNFAHILFLLIFFLFYLSRNGVFEGFVKLNTVNGLVDG